MLRGKLFQKIMKPCQTKWIPHNEPWKAQQQNPYGTVPDTIDLPLVPCGKNADKLVLHVGKNQITRIRHHNHSPFGNKKN